ncbi:hypothetical protein WJX72_001845 [[Myrmecia] bisecta]|uniref:Plastid lipid-associated protein/fibrillin conserved domain-containing protein n=1 Tax=[Myrmecia] bisecta TaxID=41462 RepID=A0AAW1Q6K7_9CHLO
MIKGCFACHRLQLSTSSGSSPQTPAAYVGCLWLYTRHSPLHHQHWHLRRQHRQATRQPPRRQPVQATSSSRIASCPEAKQVKQELQRALQGADRGIFGLQVRRRQEILDVLERLEACNPVAAPTEHLDQVAGDWRLLYTTITIQGSRRSRLGLRQMVSLGEFVQSIDIDTQTAANRVDFNVMQLASGTFSVEASYQVASPTRVDIQYATSAMVPAKLDAFFRRNEANYDLLLAIFNPEGWLETTYLDETHRIGRDDKGQIFYLERRS